MNNSIKFVELYEKASASRSASSWALREVVINPHYIVTMRPDERAPTLLREGKLPDGLDERQQFTKIHMSRGNSGVELTIVGDISTVQRAMQATDRKVIRW